jgi:serine kinase of HPr protein (carbohydrate metabolism regulator)
MHVRELLEHSNLTLLNNPDTLDNDIKGIFASDLLSHVMGQANEGDILVTVLTNINVLGVASLLDLSAVVFTHNAEVLKPIIDKANELGIPLLRTSLSTAKTVLLLSTLGVSD